jgi:hypothetical protein
MNKKKRREVLVPALETDTTKTHNEAMRATFNMYIMTSKIKISGFYFPKRKPQMK